MDITPQTREVSVEEWWAATHGTNLDGNRSPTEELPAARGLTAEQRARYHSLKEYYVDATGKILEFSTTNMQPTPRSDSPSLERPTYGSNDNVYNPYNPLASKEYLAQEIAAGRIQPAGMPPRSPRGLRKSPGSALEAPFRSRQENKPPRVLTEAMANWLERRQTSPLMATDSESSTDESPDVATSTAGNSVITEDERCRPRSSGSRPRHSLPNSYIDYDNALDFDSDGQSELDIPGLLSRMASKRTSDDLLSLGNDGFQSRRVRAAESSATAAGFLRHTFAKEQRVSSRWPIPPSSGAIGRAASHDSPFLPGLADRGRKRRRTWKTPQEPVPPPPAPGNVGVTRTTARQDPAPASGSQGRSRLRAEAPVFVPRSARTPLSLPPGGSGIDIGALPESVRLTIDRHLHPTPSFSNIAQRRTPTIMFLPTGISMRHLFFTSELIPKSFGRKKRRSILGILRNMAPYVPSCVATPPMGPKIQYHISLKPKGSLPPSSSGLDDAPLGPRGQGWPFAPNGGLPLEVFQNIARYLPRAALESMRLVNREFERNVSNIQFRSVVVPFRPEIYDIIDPRGSLRKVGDVKGKGKGKAKAKAKEDSFEQDETVKAVHDGMRVFEAWGSEVKEFAMAFEVPDDQLVSPPVRGKFEVFDAFFGSYKWPHPDYRRFELLCGLEKKADEHRYMSTALSNLRGVQVLGLCIDNGLGWLSGPDISDRAQLFKQKTRIFGAREPETKARHSESVQLWEEILSSLRPEDSANYLVDGAMISQGELPMARNQHGFYQAIIYPRVTSPRVEFTYCPESAGSPLVFQGINLAHAPSEIAAASPMDLHDLSQSNKESSFANGPIVPNKLTIPQKEWLMETEWAQRAFLSSYCMALTDNSITFQHVHTLNIAKLSSKHLGALERDDFWTALSNLTKLVMNVAPDFRAISKNHSGDVVADDINPSEAATHFFRLLKTHISKVKGVKTMTLGYYGGGERQTGIFGRNRFVLPAPLTDYTSQNVFNHKYKRVLALPHVQELTLNNCWIAPPILKTFISAARRAKLRSLTLNSVSLSAHAGVQDPSQPDPLQNGVYASPVGFPLRFMSDPYLGNFFAQRASYANPAKADPVPSNADSWVRTAGRTGSWADVIDDISPGPTLDLVRYAFRYVEDPPRRRNPAALEVISFISCGYVRLVNKPADSFDQSCLPDVIHRPPQCLRKRALDLMPVMMHRKTDQLLGQIVPVLPDMDKSLFETGFPMTIGWSGDQGLDALEDGQPLGGAGRFTGKVERLRFDEN